MTEVWTRPRLARCHAGAHRRCSVRSSGRFCAYSEAVCQTPPAVTDDLSAALLAELGADGLIELTARIGFMNLSARMNISLGIGSEHFADSCGLPPIATRPTRAPAP